MNASSSPDIVVEIANELGAVMQELEEQAERKSVINAGFASQKKELEERRKKLSKILRGARSGKVWPVRSLDGKTLRAVRLEETGEVVELVAPEDTQIPLPGEAQSPKKADAAKPDAAKSGEPKPAQAKPKKTEALAVRDPDGGICSASLMLANSMRAALIHGGKGISALRDTGAWQGYVLACAGAKESQRTSDALQKTLGQWCGPANPTDPKYLTFQLLTSELLPSTPELEASLWKTWLDLAAEQEAP